MHTAEHSPNGCYTIIGLSKDIVFIFEVHQPYRLKAEAYVELLRLALKGKLSNDVLEKVLIDHGLNKHIFERVANRCYRVATKILLETCERLAEAEHNAKFSFSISGILLEQLLENAPDLIELLRKGVEKDFFELIGQTYYHSLSSLLPDTEEFEKQVEAHRALMNEVFGSKPIVAENTEMIYNNDIAKIFGDLGFKAIITEGVDWVLHGRSPNYLYTSLDRSIKVLLRNYRLSDDVGFRFSMRTWDQYPLTADKYAEWLRATPGEVIVIAMDYETFGEHHPPETGILEFLRYLPIEITKRGMALESPSRVIDSHRPIDIYDVPPWNTISWADERDLSAWLGNEMQQRAFKLYMELEPYVKATGDPYLRFWRLLGTSDHFYYMAMKTGSTGEVHTYFSPYKSPFRAFEIYMEALLTLMNTVIDEISSKPRYYVNKIVLPKNKAFHFYIAPGVYTGKYARSLGELLKAIEELPAESMIYHIKRGDLQNWLRTYFLLEEVVAELNELMNSIVDQNVFKQRVIEALRKTLC
ncbi:MAG: alpha-amylase [Desulfurococcaceae archaeon]